MRLTDDRYSDQRRRLEIALRMIRHAARSATIRECTGISEDRIRKLHRSYFKTLLPGQRRRGKSPHQPQCFTRNLRARIDSGLLAGLLVSTGVLHEIRRKRDNRIDCDLGAKICDIYELFLHLRPEKEPSLSFEHAWFLVKTLVADTEIGLSHCPLCAGAMLLDRYAPRRAMCPLCESKHLADRSAASRRKRRTSQRSTGNS